MKNNEKQEITVSNTYSMEKASSMLNMANELQKFIKDNKLSSKIQGRDYPNYEAWQFVGANVGVSPLLVSCEDISTDDEIKYRAVMDLIRIDTQQVVGRGMAVCSNKEYSKKKFDEYAIASMSQTRAIGKAYRSVFGWLMKAAGYESCNAEEMDFETKAEEVKPNPQANPQAEKPPVELATTKQKELILSLSNSHVFKNDNTVKLVLERINSNELTKAKAVKAIEWMQEEMKDRKEMEQMEQEVVK